MFFFLIEVLTTHIIPYQCVSGEVLIIIACQVVSLDLSLPPPKPISQFDFIKLSNSFLEIVRDASWLIMTTVNIL